MGMTEVEAAIDENFLDWLVLIPENGTSRTKRTELWGEIDRINNGAIYINIFPKSVKAVQDSYKKVVYTIHFVLNRVPYQLQHLALDFIKEHNLFGQLINNPRYFNAEKNTRIEKWAKLK